MKITSKMKSVESFSAICSGIELHSNACGDVRAEVMLQIRPEDIASLHAVVKNGAVKLTAERPMLSGEALRWDGTHQGLAAITKALEVGFLMGLDEGTGEVAYFVKSTREHVNKGDFVARLDDDVFVLSHSDLVTRYDIGG
jgi:hypothetical protein